MEIKYQLLRTKSHDHGIAVRVRAVPLDEAGKPVLTPKGDPIFHEIEEVIHDDPWMDGDTPEAFARRAIEKRGWRSRSEAYLTRVLRANGLAKPKFKDVPEIDSPRDL